MTNQDYITIEGESFEVIKKTLEDWIDLYIDQLEETISFDILEKSQNDYLINIYGELSNLLFHFLVNYYRNPDKKGVKTRGYTNVKDPKQYPESELKKRVVVFVPDEDKQYDNIYASTGSGKLYIIDFGFKRTEFDELITFVEPDLSEYKTSKCKLNIPKTKRKVEKKESPQKDINQKITLVFLALLLSNIAFLKSHIYFEFSLSLLGLILSFWITFAHNNALRKQNNYLTFLGLSITLFFAGVYYDDLLSKNIDHMIAIPFFHSFFMLLSYQIVRPIYKVIFKKEPILEVYNRNFFGFLYSFFLIYLPGVISFLMIIKYLDYTGLHPK